MTKTATRKLSKKDLKKITENLEVEIKPYFTSEEIAKLARETNFVQREGKIDGEIFLDLIVFHNENLKKQSLNDLSGIVKTNYEIEITKQSLHDRFNGYGVDFLENALEKLLQQQLQSSAIKILDGHFSRVLIKDSVCFQIDESLAALYPGSGGSGSGAAIRIQFEYDLLSGTITDMSVNAFNEQDAKDSLATIEKTKEGELILRDLAYMSISVLKKIIAKAAFYLCRPHTSVKMFEIKAGKYGGIKFADLVKYMKKHKISYMEKEIYYGNKDKLKMRLILHLLPADELAKRLRNANKNNKKKGRGKLSKEYKARAALNLFITNTSKEQVPTENVWPIYRLRWQIELMFKIWKSICNIEKVKKVNEYRLECYIYSKLIFIVLSWQMIWAVAKNMYLIAGKALSFFKAYKNLFNEQRKEFQDALESTKEVLIKFVADFYDLSVTNHLLEKRKQEPTSLEILLTCFS